MHRNAPSPPTAAEDSRFRVRHDLDHPYAFDPRYADRAQWERRASFVRRQVAVALGLWPLPAKTPLEPVIHGRIERDDYTIEKVFFASLPGHYVSGLLYRPAKSGGRFAGVLCPHGHWSDGRFHWSPDDRVQSDIAGGAEKWEGAARSANQARCATLARLGCVAFFYDMIGYADSQPLDHRSGFADAGAVLRLQSMMGLQTWNSIRALDFLSSLPDVDENRLAITGESGGATQTIALSVMDDRLAAAFPAVMVSAGMQGGCACENAPLLRVETCNAELVSLFAPKPQGMSAADDWTRDLLTRGYPEIRRIYQLYGAADRVEAQYFPFPHGYNQPSREMMYNVMNRALNLGFEPPVMEEPTLPIAPAEVSVFDAAHPRPVDTLGVAGIRQWMTQTSDRQLAELAGDPARYAEIVGGALEAMVVDSLPSSDHVEVRQHARQTPLPLDHAGIWQGFISRAGCGERVPVAAAFPQEWNGDIAIWSEISACKNLIGGAVETDRLLRAGAAVFAVDPFMTEDFRPRPESSARTDAAGADSSSEHPAYHGGFVLGYNRSDIANRVRDLLSAIALVRGWKGVRRLNLIALGAAGAAGFLAKALANDAVDRAAIDLHHFDLHRITDARDPMLLPGALKYGGVFGFAPLCTHGRTLLCNASPSKNIDFVRRAAIVEIYPDDITEASAAAVLVRWLLER